MVEEVAYHTIRENLSVSYHKITCLTQLFGVQSPHAAELILLDVLNTIIFFNVMDKVLSFFSI